MAGREEALRTLRSRALGLARKHGAAIRGEQRSGQAVQELSGSAVDAVTKRGTIIYNVGKDALRDDGESFRISRDASLDTAILALTIAKRRFGEVLRLDGDLAFRERMIRAAAAGRVAVRFADPLAEARRVELSHHPIPDARFRKEYKEYERE
jgi:hypothetical protein